MTTRAMRELLQRKGITPTGDAEKDMVLAKSVMPKGYKQLGKQGHIKPWTQE